MKKIIGLIIISFLVSCKKNYNCTSKVNYTINGEKKINVFDFVYEDASLSEIKDYETSKTFKIFDESGNEIQTSEMNCTPQ